MSIVKIQYSKCSFGTKTVKAFLNLNLDQTICISFNLYEAFEKNKIYLSAGLISELDMLQVIIPSGYREYLLKTFSNIYLKLSLICCLYLPHPQTVRSIYPTHTVIQSLGLLAFIFNAFNEGNLFVIKKTLCSGTIQTFILLQSLTPQALSVPERSLSSPQLI